MKHALLGKAVVLCAALSLPALAAAPASGAIAAPKSARVIVKFKSDGTLMRESALAARTGELPRVQHASRLAQRHGVAMSDGYPVAPRTQVVFAQGLSSAELVAKLQADPEVDYAEVDVRVRRADVPNDPLYGNQIGGATPTSGQWYLRPPTAQFVSAIDAQSAWDVTTGSASVVVAVLDTGVRPNHPDLVGKLLAGYDFVSADSPGVFATANDSNGRDADPSDPGDWVTQSEANGVFAGENCAVEDSSWHGTQTAALIGASTNNGIGMSSVGRDVRILPVRVLGKCGGFQSDVIAGMYWAAGLPIPPSPSTLGTAPTNPSPARVLNLSLGSAPPCSQLYSDAVSAVIAAGAAVVVSAGNDVGQAVGQPANCPGAIGVGGLRHVGTKVGFSDVGPEVALSAPGGNCVNLSGACLFPILTATNSGITVPAGDTYSDSFNISVGTSFSAPLVAGTAALMLSANSALSPSQVRVGLMRTSRAFPTSGAGAIPVCHAPDSTEQDECYCTTSTCGAGMLSTANAVSAAGALKAWIVPSATQVSVRGTISLDGTNSWARPPASITSRVWEIRSGSEFASLQGVNAPTAALAASAPGTVVVRLTVTDGVSNPSFDETTIVVGDASPPAAGGGGGALSWPWLLALWAALLALRPRRSV